MKSYAYVNIIIECSLFVHFTWFRIFIRGRASIIRVDVMLILTGVRIFLVGVSDVGGWGVGVGSRWINGIGLLLCIGILIFSLWIIFGLQAILNCCIMLLVRWLSHG